MKVPLEKTSIFLFGFSMKETIQLGSAVGLLPLVKASSTSAAPKQQRTSCCSATATRCWKSRCCFRLRRASRSCRWGEVNLKVGIVMDPS